MSRIRRTNFQEMMRHKRPHPHATPPEGVADATGDGAPAGDPLAADGFDPMGAQAVTDDQAVARLQAQLAEQQDKLLRLAAEYDNYRKRAVRDRQKAELEGMAALIRGILEALDDLGRFAHVDLATTDATTLQQGVEMVEKKLLKSLAGHGLEIVNPVGQPFDPAVHEALVTVPAESAEEDHLIAQVYQVGYVFNGQLLRAARVVVKQWNGGRRESADQG
jgi:molecular chaperone GrpE